MTTLQRFMRVAQWCAVLLLMTPAALLTVALGLLPCCVLYGAWMGLRKAWSLAEEALEDVEEEAATRAAGERPPPAGGG